MNERDDQLRQVTCPVFVFEPQHGVHDKQILEPPGLGKYGLQKATYQWMRSILAVAIPRGTRHRPGDCGFRKHIRSPHGHEGMSEAV